MRDRNIENIRNRAKRFVNNLEKLQATQKPRQAAATQRYIDQLNQNIAGTYANGRTKEQQQSAAQRIQNFIGASSTRSAKKRQDIIFKKEFARASMGMPSPLFDEGSETKIKGFFRVTQRFWEGTDPAQRLETITKKLGFQTFEQAYNYVMETMGDDIKSVLSNENLSEREKYDQLKRAFIVL